MNKHYLNLVIVALLASSCASQKVTVPMYLTDQKHSFVGNITLSDSKYGLMLSPALNNVTPEVSAGIHGFHVHENPSCAKDGMAAGGHLDPQKSNHHYGPYNSNGHLGDLPALYVNADGSVNTAVVAPRLKLKDVYGRSLMIHHGGDNYSDTPTLGGGGSRMICGVIPKRP